MTNSIRKLWAIGALLLFFVLLFHSPLSLKSAEQAKLKITSSKLIVLDEAPEIDQEYDQYRYDEAKASRVVVYSVMTGYKDAKGTKYLPFFKISIKKVDKYIIQVDFLSLQTTTVEFRMIMEGVNFVPMLQDLNETKVTKNVYYRKEFEIEVEEGIDGLKYDPSPGVYDITIMIGSPKGFFNSRGMSSASCRVEYTK